MSFSSCSLGFVGDFLDVNIFTNSTLFCISTTQNYIIHIIQYTTHSFDVIATATPLVIEQIKKQPLRPFGVGSPAYHIADYGTADAGTSLGLMNEMIQAVRERAGGDKEVVVHYEDQLT